MRGLLSRGWFLAILVGLIAFLLIALDVIYEGLLFQFDHRVAEWFYRTGTSNTTVFQVVEFITNLGGSRVLTVVGIVNTVILLLARYWRLALVFAIGQYVVNDLSPWVKSHFQRPRPPFLGWDDFCFPSGHALGSTVIYGCSMVVIWSLARSPRSRLCGIAINLLLIMGIAISRPLYGAHFLSDVLAGVAIGTAYVGLLSVIGNAQRAK